MAAEKPQPTGKDLEILKYLKEKKKYDFIVEKVHVSRSRISQVKNNFLQDSTKSTTKSTGKSTTKKKKKQESTQKQERPNPKTNLNLDSTMDDSTGDDSTKDENKIPLAEINLLIRSAKSKWSYGTGKYPNMDVIIDNVVNWVQKQSKEEANGNK